MSGYFSYAESIQLALSFSEDMKVTNDYAEIFGLSLMCEATQTDASWLLQFPFGSHVCFTVWSNTVAIVTDADLLSVGHLTLALLWRTL